MGHLDTLKNLYAEPFGAFLHEVLLSGKVNDERPGTIINDRLPEFQEQSAVDPHGFRDGRF